MNECACFESSYLHDEQILDQLRHLLTHYIQNKTQGNSTSQESNIKTQFDTLHRQLHDPMLKSYANFNFFEKLLTIDQDKETSSIEKTFD